MIAVTMKFKQSKSKSVEKISNWNKADWDGLRTGARNKNWSEKIKDL